MKRGPYRYLHREDAPCRSVEEALSREEVLIAEALLTEKRPFAQEALATDRRPHVEEAPFGEVCAEGESFVREALVRRGGPVQRSLHREEVSCK